MDHLTPEQLTALVDDALDLHARREAEAHVAGCARCQTEVAALREQDRALAASRAHDPGEDYFESFASRVEARVRDSKASGERAAAARPRAGSPEPWWHVLTGWLRSPRRVAWAGGVAVLIVGAGVALMLARQSDELLLQQAAPGRDQKAAEPQPGMRDRASQSRGADGATDRLALEGNLGTAEDERGSEKAGSEVGSKEAARGTAAPSGVMEMRKNEQGEDVPADRDAASRRFAQAPAPARDPAPGERGAVEKPGARPLGASKLDDREGAAKQTAGAEQAQSKTMAKSSAPPATAANQRLAQGDYRARTDTALESFDRSAAGAMESKDARRLCGEVRDTSGRPLALAQVVVLPPIRTAQSGADGRFCVEVPTGAVSFKVMALGFRPSERPIADIKEGEPLAITLQAVEVMRQVPSAGSETLARPPADAREKEYAALSESVMVQIREAQRLTSKASAGRAPTQWEEAARAWERLAGSLPEGFVRTDARYRAADARYHAWEIEPSDQRRARARSAVNTFLSSAPQGPERDRAESWLEILGR